MGLAGDADLRQVSCPLFLLEGRGGFRRKVIILTRGLPGIPDVPTMSAQPDLRFAHGPPAVLAHTTHSEACQYCDRPSDRAYTSRKTGAHEIRMVCNSIFTFPVQQLRQEFRYHKAYSLFNGLGSGSEAGIELTGETNNVPSMSGQRRRQGYARLPV